VKSIRDRESYVEIDTTQGVLLSRRVAICCADGLSAFTDVTVKKSYAPMFVVSGVPQDSDSFVELDYHPRSCINLINKGDGYGLAGGISVGRMDQVDPYYKYCVNLHRERNPSIQVLDMYVGEKKEMVSNGQDRNYLYHIMRVSDNVSGVVLGKFTLMFSLAPEFVRRVYHKNPPRVQNKRQYESSVRHPKLSNTCWYDIVSEMEKSDGND
jgi:hypothetical protein